MIILSNYIVQFPLKTEKWQEDILEKRFEIGRQIYNTLVNVTQKRYKEMVKTKKYRNLKAKLTGNKGTDTPIWKQINAMRKEYRFSDYVFQADVTKIRKHFEKQIPSQVAQKIATEVWKSYEKYFYGDGKHIRYKRYGEFNSFEGKTNTTGLRFIQNTLYWGKLIIPVVIDYNNLYEVTALQGEIAYCRVLRKYVKHKYRYCLQLVFKGKPPVKTNKETGEVKHSIGKGCVGLDIGTSTIAIVSENTVRLQSLSTKLQDIENQKRRLLRKLDRSRRATNLDNYNPDGTIKSKGNKKLTWVKSKHYIKYQNILKELYRKQAAKRKYEHECLANYIVTLGDAIYVETMKFKGLQKKSKKTETNSKGKYKRKKRFGKTIANHAPSMLLSIIDRKLSYYGNSLHKIDTYSVKASQYNHIDNTYKKKKLSQRWNNINGDRIQRDLYSAFLIMNVASDLKSVDIEKCNRWYDIFKKKHDREIERLSQQTNNPTCMGIW